MIGDMSGLVDDGKRFEWPTNEFRYARSWFGKRLQQKFIVADLVDHTGISREEWREVPTVEG